MMIAPRRVGCYGRIEMLLVLFLALVVVADTTTTPTTTTTSRERWHPSSSNHNTNRRRLEKWEPPKTYDADCDTYLEQQTPQDGNTRRQLDSSDSSSTGSSSWLARWFYSGVEFGVSVRQSSEPPLPCRDTTEPATTTTTTESIPSTVSTTTYSQPQQSQPQPSSSSVPFGQSVPATTTPSNSNYIPKQDETTTTTTTPPATTTTNTVQVSISVALPATWTMDDTTTTATASHDSLAAFVSSDVGTAATQLFHSTLDYAIHMLQTNTNTNPQDNDQEDSTHQQQPQLLLQQLQSIGLDVAQLLQQQDIATSQEELYQWILQYLDLQTDPTSNNDPANSPMLDALKQHLRDTVHQLLFQDNTNTNNTTTTTDRWEMFLQDVHTTLVQETDDYAWYTFTLEYPVYIYVGDQWTPVWDQNTLDFLDRLLERVLQGAALSGAFLTALRAQVGAWDQELVWAVAWPGYEFPLHDGSAPEGATPPDEAKPFSTPRPWRPEAEMASVATLDGVDDPAANKQVLEDEEALVGTYPRPLLIHGDSHYEDDVEDLQARRQLGWGLLWATCGSVVALVSMAMVRSAMRQKLQRQQLHQAVWALGTDQDVAELLKIKWRTTAAMTAEEEEEENAPVVDVEQQPPPTTAQYLEVYTTKPPSQSGYQTDDSMLHGSSLPHLTANPHGPYPPQ